MSQSLLHEILGASLLEQGAAVISLAAIWLGTRQAIISWPLDMVSSGLYALVFFKAGLYADTLLQFIFICMSIYGWFIWSRGLKSSRLLVRSITLSEVIIASAFTLVFTFAGGMLLENFSHASQPYTDSFCTALSISATWLAAHKVLENWTIWIFTNGIYIALFVNKHLYPTAILYFVLLLLAISGLYSWKNTLNTNVHDSNTAR